MNLYNYNAIPVFKIIDMLLSIHSFTSLFKSSLFESVIYSFNASMLYTDKCFLNILKLKYKNHSILNYSVIITN